MDEFERALASVLPRLRRFAHGLTRDGADADDLTQQTAERALKSRALWQVGTNFDAWAYRIMRNLWIDTARSRQRQAKIFAPEEAGEQIGAPGEAEASVERRYLMRAMGKLSDEQREVVALVLIEGLSYAQAAEVLDVPAGTVASRVGRGREALARILGGNEP